MVVDWNVWTDISRDRIWNAVWISFIYGNAIPIAIPIAIPNAIWIWRNILGGDEMGHGHRYMYYMTGLPGWIRFGFSPGWGGLPPAAQYLTQSGQLPQFMSYLQQQMPIAPATMPTMPMGTPTSPIMPTSTMPTMAPTTIPKEQEISMLEQQAKVLEQQMETIRKRIEELRK
jgi:hypothetical protein